MEQPSMILFFVKQPLPGGVKSRIAEQLGQDAALALYRSFVLDMLDMLDSTGMPLRVCVHPPRELEAASAWLGPDRDYLPQEGTDLGERMANAFLAAFSAGAERALLIGSDLPDLPGTVLREAADALGQSDVVLGPARDGGYYLIGFHRETFLPGVFRGMTWGTPDVLIRTGRMLDAAGASVHLLPLWQDVDTVDDLRDLMRRNRTSLFAKSRTMAECAKIDALRREDLHAEV